MTFQVSREDGLFYRQTLFDQARRVVIKVSQKRQRSVIIDS